MSHPVKAGFGTTGASAIARLAEAELEGVSGGDKAPPPPPPAMYLHFTFKLVAVKTVS